jgi:CRISPR/Cas system CSM-associated protein Csm5 (group 7 of RAMP superfamily)
MALVGADAYKFKDTERNKADLIRAGFYWKKEFVESSNPEGNAIKTKNWVEYTYDSFSSLSWN